MLHNYEILSQIGIGGMGKVFLGKHKLFERLVAIKSLTEEYVNNEDIRTRFSIEATTLSMLEHPNIVKLYDFIEEDNNCYLIMEYVNGITLDQTIKSGTKFDLNTSIQIFHKILDAINYAHLKNIIHRDIKPSNIILEGTNPKILDFGIAKILTSDKSLTKTGTKIGSMLYMSPEQVLGNQIGITTDIYSLGVMLFEMLTGKIPYNLSSDSEYIILENIVHQPLLHASSVNSKIPKTIDDVIFKATVKNPELRYQSCEEFSYALTSVMSLNNSNENNYTKTFTGSSEQFQSGSAQFKSTQPFNANNDESIRSNYASQKPGTNISSNSNSPKRKSYSNLYLVLIVIAALVLTFSLYEFVIKDGNLTGNQSYSKYVPVVNLVNIEPRNGYQIIGKPTLSPEVVKITGPESVVKEINYVETKKETVSDISENNQLKVRLYSNAEISFEPNEIAILFDIEPIQKIQRSETNLRNSVNPEDEAAIKRVVNDMLTAWQNKDVYGFFENLTDDYRYESRAGVKRNYNQRLNKSYEIFENNRYITISTWDMIINSDGKFAEVKYRQRYNSTVVNETTTKKLFLRKENGVWKVYKELSGFN